jgi:8-oxo-dGTP pyrophosphatase MutT (NUDIX family)
VPALKPTHVEVYVFRRRRNGVEFLILRRSPGRSLPGVWQPVTGRIRPRERAVTAAAREVFEETGFRPVRWWALETVAIYFDAALDRVMALPLFVAEVPRAAAIELSSEHDAHRFVRPKVAASLVLWEAQRLALAAVDREILSNARLARALEVTARVPARFRPRAANARRSAR